MDKSFEAPQGRLISTLIIFVFVLVLLYTLFMVFQNITVKAEISRVNKESASLETEIAALKEEQIQELVVAENVTELLETRVITWSQVIRKLEDLTPVTVFFRTYSGSDEGILDLTALANTYAEVADLIRILSESDDFDDAFVPSMARGLTSDGQEVISFSLKLHSTIE